MADDRRPHAPEIEKSIPESRNVNIANPSMPIAEAPGLTYQQLLDREDIDPPPPPVSRFHNPVDLGVEPIKASRYTSREFFELEVEKMWLKTWQYTCREEEIPNAGDTYVFDLVGRSVLIVRQQDGAIKALQNVCRHRGRKLATHGGCKSRLRCPYHGLTWNIDGSFQHNPFAWDFPQVDEAAFGLPELRLETWAGFIFINFDADAAPLLGLLGAYPEHMDHFQIDDSYKAVHLGKVVNANWKACAEAFLESSHVIGTHPQAASYAGYDQVQYDLISDHVTRFVVPMGVTSEVWTGPELSDEQKIRAALGNGSRGGPPGAALAKPLREGQTMRNYLAEIARENLERDTGYDFSARSDGELLDGFSYDVFPNTHIWGGFTVKICYRIRPYGMDHERSLLEIFLMKIKPKGTNPAPAQYRLLGPDELLADAPELGGSYLGGLLDQDVANLGPQQDGLRALGPDGELTFGRYSDMRCRNLHRMIDDYLAR
ncbi:aromatic ring-hydroxylating dioxygenase subunit alpha [Sphingomonas sp. MG17]|uniref:Aromatic ring-hydroxylating dioxygenase subunit alpha n=1 Tax=Sphingomonas tagetis TaxID=2949092 RepID=A0A9X2HR05_9SPHN|nr:aromatic ring-hydroxylating dioxygenase subunit alpha [Sphingomonas tagetis]